MKPETLKNYKIEALLSQSSWVDVFQATRLQTGQPVIFKLFNCPAMSAEGQELLQTLEQAAELQHPYIARIYEVGVENNYPFVVEEFIGTSTLADVAEKQRIGRSGHRICRMGIFPMLSGISRPHAWNRLLWLNTRNQEEHTAGCAA